MKPYLSAVLLFSASLGIGCSHPTRAVPADNAAASKVKTEIDANGSFVVNERFVVLPVEWPNAGKGQSVYYLGSMAIQRSAWSQFAVAGSSGFPLSGTALNFTVVDLESGAKQRIFDHPVAASVHPSTFIRTAETNKSEDNWSSRMARQHDPDLRFAGLLILIARTQDANSDKQIDYRDSAWLYAYDVSGGKLKRVSPPGYRVEYMRLLKDIILVFMSPESAPVGNTSTLAIYKYDPKTDKGELIKDIQ
jgi:hypothetical protein